MKNLKASRLNMFVLELLLILMLACDTFQEDAISPDKLIEFGQTDFYILPGTSAVIDISSIVERTFTKGAVVIAKQPGQGILTKLNSLVLIYKPHINFTEGTDVFDVSVTDNGKTLVTETISIHMSPNETGADCPIFAVQDVRSLNSNSPITIKFLVNDRFCDLDIQNIQASIYLPPSHGEATLDGDVITYTPHPELYRGDTIVYKIRITHPSIGSSPKDFFGLITFARLSCLSYLPQEIHVDLRNSVGEVASTDDCGEGVLIYKLMEDWRSCVEGTDFEVVLMGQTGSSGTVCYEPTTGFVFVSDMHGEPGNVDVHFRIYVQGQYKDFIIYVQLLKTNWARLGSVSNGMFTEDQARSVFFVDNQRGFVGGESIWKTVDGGLSWRHVFPWYTYGVLEINDIFFVDENNGFAGYKDSFNGGLLKTVDGGENWTLVESPKENTVSVYFISHEVGFIGTASGNLQVPETGRIYRTTDGGMHWTVARAGWFRVHNIQVRNDGVGFANAGYLLLRTDNQGASWASNSLLAINPDPNEGISALADNGRQLFLKFSNTLWTSDGTNFEQKRPDELDTYHNAISFSPSGKVGVLVGSRDWAHGGFRAEVLMSFESGETWTRAETEAPRFKGLELIDVSVPTDETAFALSNNGFILKFKQE